MPLIDDFAGQTQTQEDQGQSLAEQATDITKQQPEAPVTEEPAEENEGDTETDEEQEAETDDEQETETEENKDKETELAKPFIDYAKKVFPGMDFRSEQEAQQAVIEEIEDLRTYRKKNRVAIKAFTDLLQSNENVANFFSDLAKGAPEAEAIARNFDIENLKPQEGDPDYEAWEKGNQERIKRVKEQEKQKKLLEYNQKASVDNFDAWCKKRGITKQKGQQDLQKMFELINQFNMLEINEQALDTMYRAIHHEEEVEKAEKKAAIKAKNEVASKKIEKKDPVGDGLPNITGSGKTPEGKAKLKESDFPFLGAIDKYEKRQLI